MNTKEFGSLDELLAKNAITHHSERIKNSQFVKQGEYYDKSLLSALSNPMIVKPTHLGNDNAKTEPPFEVYMINYKGGTFIGVLPLRENKNVRDSREPIFLIKSDLTDYFLSAKIGYCGYSEMTFSDNLHVLKSIVQFPTTGFNIMTPNEVMQTARQIGSDLLSENYHLKYGLTKLSGWKKQFENSIVTQVKADDGSQIRYNPMFFLVIHNK